MTLHEIKEKIIEMGNHLEGNYAFTPDNIYQVGNDRNRAIVGKILDQFLLPGSRLENIDALIELFRRCEAGESCLLLAEHYSNFDYPVFYRLVEKTPGLGEETAARLLPIRGMKLSETSNLTAIFTHSYDAIIIYPSRSLDSISDPAELEEVRKISVPINHAAMREMITRKHHGRLILVFPAGTRYRPWDPQSNKGVREIYSYLKNFDNIMFMSINGNALPPNETDDMTQDQPEKDLIILTCSEITAGRRFIKESEQSAPEGCDLRQHVVNQVMAKLLAMHNQVEPLRLAEKESQCLKIQDMK